MQPPLAYVITITLDVLDDTITIWPTALSWTNSTGTAQSPFRPTGKPRKPLAETTIIHTAGHAGSQLTSAMVSIFSRPGFGVAWNYRYRTSSGGRAGWFQGMDSASFHSGPVFRTRRVVG